MKPPRRDAAAGPRAAGTCTLQTNTKSPGAKISSLWLLVCFALFSLSVATNSVIACSALFILSTLRRKSPSGFSHRTSGTPPSLGSSKRPDKSGGRKAPDDFPFIFSSEGLWECLFGAHFWFPPCQFCHDRFGAIDGSLCMTYSPVCLRRNIIVFNPFMVHVFHCTPCPSRINPNISGFPKNRFPSLLVVPNQLIPFCHNFTHSKPTDFINHESELNPFQSMGMSPKRIVGLNNGPLWWCRLQTDLWSRDPTFKLLTKLDTESSGPNPQF